MSTHERLDLAEELSALTAGRLRPRDDLAESDLRFWEKRSLNIHRVVALCDHGVSKAREIGVQVRATIGRRFRRAWWRGLGFGVVVEVRAVEGFPEEFRDLVDGRENPRGTWPWVILVSRERRQASGLHTWIEGYLSPVYRGRLARLHEEGFEIESVRKEKDGLMKLLTAARPRCFRDFCNDVGGAGPAVEDGGAKRSAQAQGGSGPPATPGYSRQGAPIQRGGPASPATPTAGRARDPDERSSQGRASARILAADWPRTGSDPRRRRNPEKEPT